MPILDLYEHGDHKKNLAHFATLASLAAVDGEINPKEMAVLEKFAFKLNISEEEFKEVITINYFLRWNYPDQVQGSSVIGSSQPAKTSSPTLVYVAVV